jgi:streptogramin lyase
MGGLFMAGLAAALGVAASTPALSEHVLRPVPILGGTPAALLREPRAIVWDPVREWTWVADAEAGRIVALDSAGEVARWTRASRPVALALSPDGTLWSVEGTRVVRRTRRLEILSTRWPPTPTPAAIAVSPDGEVWIADPDAGWVAPLRKTGSPFHSTAPTGIAFDSEGDLFVADPADRIVYRLQRDRVQDQVRLPRSPLGMYAPIAVGARDGGGVLVLDAARGELHEIELGRIRRTLRLPAAGLPEGVVAGPAGTAFIVDRLHPGTLRVDLDEGPASRFSGPAGDERILDRPISLAAGPDGLPVWIADRGRERLIQVDRAGRLLGSIAIPGIRHVTPDSARGAWVATDRGELWRLGPDLDLLDRQGLPSPASALLADGSGGVWVAQPDDGSLRQLDPSGFQLARLRPRVSGPFLPHDLAPGPDGSLWVLDAIHGTIYRLDPDGRTLARVRCAARSVTSDPDGGVWVVDTTESHLRQFGPDGRETRRIPVGRGLNPLDVAALWMSPDGTLWAADDARHRILRLVPETPAGDAR